MGPVAILYSFSCRPLKWTSWSNQGACRIGPPQVLSHSCEEQLGRTPVPRVAFHEEDFSKVMPIAAQGALEIFFRVLFNDLTGSAAGNQGENNVSRIRQTRQKVSVARRFLRNGDGV